MITDNTRNQTARNYGSPPQALKVVLNLFVVVAVLIAVYGGWKFFACWQFSGEDWEYRCFNNTWDPQCARELHEF